MKFAQPIIFGALALVAMLLASQWPSSGWIFMLFSLPLWLLCVVFLVRSLRP
jgi:hypothetical protein